MLTPTNGEVMNGTKNNPKKFGRRYPWQDWFGRGEFTLLRGKDFHCKTHGMAAMVRNAASRHRIRIHMEQDELRLKIKVIHADPTTTETA